MNGNECDEVPCERGVGTNSVREMLKDYSVLWKCGARKQSNIIYKDGKKFL
jgi:hypothetical protein